MKLFVIKPLVLAVAMFAMPLALLAQTEAPAKASSKAAVKKSTPKSPADIRRAALKAVEEVTAIDEDPNVTLTAADVAIAERVFVGVIPCELGASVTITASKLRPGFFVVQTGKMRFRMHPVESRTGAVRIEDPKQGAMWLQLGNKSMLMSQKLGQRLADECMSPEQVTLADELKKNPRPGLLDSPVPASGTAPATAK
ncbi:MAG: hypothetical protein H7197_08105 [Vitreoscilla sp.]|nr:hypothetical protein [Polaromonas sp.]